MFCLLEVVPVQCEKINSFVVHLMASAFIRRRPQQSTVTHQSAPFSSAAASRSTLRVCGQSPNSMISPRSSNYERLEGGLGPSRLEMRNIAWRKILLCLTITFGILWFLKPSKESVWSIKNPGESLCLYVVRVKDMNGLTYPCSVETTRANRH